MLKSIELKASIRSLRDEIQAGVDQNLDMSAKAQELEALIAECDSVIADENKKKKIQTKETNMSKNEVRASFNRALKALLLARPVAEADMPNKPIEIKAEGSGNYPTDDNGSAYLIPEEFLTELVLNDGLVDLSGLIDHLTVAAPSGKYPVIDMSQDIELVDFVNDNETEIDKKSAAFTQDNYELGTRGILVPIARELIQDASVDVIAIIHKLLGKTKIKTVNKDIIAAAQVGAGTDTCDVETVEAIDKIKEVLIAKLPISYVANAKILMNQNTFAKMANIKDETGNYMIQPDVTLGMRYAINAHEIVVCENRDLADDKIIVGDFKMIRMFERVGYEVMSDASAGFKTNSILIRAIARFVVKNTYGDAFVVLN